LLGKTLRKIFFGEIERTMTRYTRFLYVNIFFMACFTFNKLLFGRAYNIFHKALPLTPFIGDS